MTVPASPTADDVLALYPALRGVQPPLAEVLRAHPLMTVPAGTLLFDEGDPCKGFPLLLQGEVRIARRSEDGRALELYRVRPGEICLVSSACVFGARPLAAQGAAAEPTTLMLAPPATFRAWLTHPPFRDFVLGLFAERMAELTVLVDAIAFQRLDQRLAAALLGRGPEIATTHQQLAETLGTVREMVTRVLRRFEREGFIELARERIRIRDSAGLRRCAAGLV